jgi:hypothetical protein
VWGHLFEFIFNVTFTAESLVPALLDPAGFSQEKPIVLHAVEMVTCETCDLLDTIMVNDGQSELRHCSSGQADGNSHRMNSKITVTIDAKICHIVIDRIIIRAQDCVDGNVASITTDNIVGIQ